MRVLAVEVDQRRAELRKLRERRRSAVDPCAAAALHIERAAHEQRPVIGQILLDQPRTGCGRVTEIELGGELGALAARPQLPGLEPTAEQER